MGRIACPNFPAASLSGNDAVRDGRAEIREDDRRFKRTSPSGVIKPKHDHITTSFWWVTARPGGRMAADLRPTDISCDVRNAVFPPRGKTASATARLGDGKSEAAPRDGGGGHPCAGLHRDRGDPRTRRHYDTGARRNRDFGEWQGLAHGELDESRAGDFPPLWHANRQRDPAGGGALRRRHRAGCRGHPPS